jgi:O-acetyl-ADP-ribose deacetylase (regulator of RNase III)
VIAKGRLNTGRTAIELVQGDITQQATDAIVNAANSTLMGGGGVDGAIHRSGGPAILEACEEIVTDIGRLPTGQAVITTGGNLPARFVIHTVGPVWNDGSRGEATLLADAYRNSLTIAAANELKSISFPAISTGAYRFPVAQAAEIALRTVVESVAHHDFDLIRFVLFSESDLETYADALERLR